MSHFKKRPTWKGSHPFELILDSRYHHGKNITLKYFTEAETETACGDTYYTENRNKSLNFNAKHTP